MMVAVGIIALCVGLLLGITTDRLMDADGRRRRRQERRLRKLYREGTIE